MFKINTRNMHKLTRLAKAKADQDKIGATAKAEVDRLYKAHFYGLSDDIHLNEPYSVKKAEECRQESLDLVNKFHGTNHILNKERYDGVLFFTIPHVVDLENKAIHFIKTPYTFETHALYPEDVMDDTEEYYLKSSISLLNKLGYNIEHGYYHDVLVDTPEHLLSNERPRETQILGDLPLEKRVTTVKIDVSYDDNMKNYNEYVDAVKKIVDYMKVIKAKG